MQDCKNAGMKECKNAIRQNTRNEQSGMWSHAFMYYTFGFTQMHECKNARTHPCNGSN